MRRWSHSSSSRLVVLGARSRRRPPRARWAGSPSRRRAPAASACAAWRPARSRAPGWAGSCRPRRRPARRRRCRSGAGSPRMITKKTTIARIVIQAPARNLVTSTITSTTAVKVEPEGVDHARAEHPAPHRRVLLGLQVPGPVPDHAELAEVERDEDADDVELDQPGGLGVEDQDQDDRHHRQEDDAVAVGQPVAARAQRARGVAVLGQDRAEHREAVERGVGGQHQDDPGHGDHEVEAGREVVEDRPRDLGDDRVLVVVGRHGVAVDGVSRSKSCGST